MRLVTLGLLISISCCSTIAQADNYQPNSENIIELFQQRYTKEIAGEQINAFTDQAEADYQRYKERMLMTQDVLDNAYVQEVD